MIIPSDTDTRFKFKVGDTAYSRDRLRLKITQRLLHLSEAGPHCPHYLAVDDNGVQWQFSQLVLSKKVADR